MSDKNTQRRIHVHYNAACIDCDTVDKEMVRVGAFHMCCKCMKKVFPEGVYNPKSPEYKARLDTWKKEPSEED